MCSPDLSSSHRSVWHHGLMIQSLSLTSRLLFGTQLGWSKPTYRGKTNATRVRELTFADVSMTGSPHPMTPPPKIGCHHRVSMVLHLVATPGSPSAIILILIGIRSSKFPCGSNRSKIAHRSVPTMRSVGCQALEE